MEKHINSKLEIIEKAITWVKNTDSMNGAKGDFAYRNLVNCRRAINRKKYALESNPAAAIYGESQVGKSYLISSLLSEEGKTFNIIGAQGKEYNFIEQINPKGKGSESTSIVSRFTVSYKPLNQAFPIKALLLSPAELALVLCDSYYNDVKTNRDQLIKSETINNEIDTLKIKLYSAEYNQGFLNEDDILDMQDYFERYLSKGNEICGSNFFNDVSLFISKIKPENWHELLSLLWNKNEYFTQLFKDLIHEYQNINFAECLYLPVESVLRDYGTLLDVNRLKELYIEINDIEQKFTKVSEAILIQNANEQKIEINKSYLCILCAELVFSQPESLIKTKPFLKESDLLDFPGTRSRMNQPAELIQNENIPDLLLRGKVAYLFNKYSEFEKINLLLFCAKHEQASQRSIGEMLNNWVNKSIGDSPEARERFINYSKIAPLFIVSTFFNVNLEFDQQHDKEDNDSNLKYRWFQRFENTLSSELIEKKNYSWFEDWTTTNPYFNNLFLLRNFVESDNKIFSGFYANKKELTEIVPDAYPTFRKKLKASFLNFDFIKKHFADPENSWDRAASINEDGTGLIIEKLAICATNINTARSEKITNELDQQYNNLINILKEYYNSSDKADILLKSIQTAGSIQLEFDLAFGNNKYFFSFMMKEFVISNSDVFNLFISKIREIEKRDVVDMDKYSGIRMHVPELNPNLSFDENLESLRKHYEIGTLADCKESFENKDGIDLNELFYGNLERVKSFSQVLAKELEIFWFEKYMKQNQGNLNGFLSEDKMHEVLDMLRRLYIKLGITEKIANKIRNYADGYRNIEDVYEMIADISTEMINKFINSVGLDYYNDSHFSDLEKVSENINGLNWKHSELQFENNSKSEVAHLITQMDDLPNLLNQNPLPLENIKLLPNYKNYKIWYNLLKVGFITASGIPNYDPIANANLGQLIKETESLKN